MAKQMPYDDTIGNHYDSSYWRVAQTNVDWVGRTIVVSFIGYKDQASRTANREPIGARSYSAVGDAFDLYRQMYEAQNPRPDIRDMAYMVATATKDVVVDPNDPSKNVSFFDGATDIL